MNFERLELEQFTDDYIDSLESSGQLLELTMRLVEDLKSINFENPNLWDDFEDSDLDLKKRTSVKK